MHWTAVTGETENHLCKRNTCILIFTKLSTLANTVLRDSNFILGEKREKVVNMSWQKKAQLTAKAIYSISFESKKVAGEGKVLCAYVFIY